MSCSAPAQLDIVIPVYNEGPNILRTLDALDSRVKTPCRILICYDFEEDNTLAALRERGTGAHEVCLVKNKGRGPHRAVLSGFEASQAPAILVYPADDDYNAGIVDDMVRAAMQGHDIVCASRFLPGGSMVGCPWLKGILIRLAAFSLYHFARLPTRDPSNGFRLFSRRLLTTVCIESSQGFSYSLELLAKCHRLGWMVAEVPAQWRERTAGKSRFRVLLWLPAYLQWYFYPYATTYLRRGPSSVLTKARAGAHLPTRPHG
jgi:glycosyltransferase involved in cell wall biosynthesis